jgi:hypothetical protein
MKQGYLKSQWVKKLISKCWHAILSVIYSFIDLNIDLRQVDVCFITFFVKTGAFFFSFCILDQHFDINFYLWSLEMQGSGRSQTIVIYHDDIVTMTACQVSLKGDVDVTIT